MAFQFIPAGNNVKNSPIVWKFENHETVYQSEQVRFERNVEFWRNKNGFKSTERVVTLNGEFQPLEYTEFQEVEETKEQEYIEFTELKEETNDEHTNNEFIDSADISESDAQPSISQDNTDIIDTPIKKSRRKTS